MAVAGAVVVLGLLVLAVFAPFIAPAHFSEGDLVANNASPGERFPLGADFMAATC